VCTSHVPFDKAFLSHVTVYEAQESRVVVQRVAQMLAEEPLPELTGSDLMKARETVKVA
jgi:hypothetical protein